MPTIASLKSKIARMVTDKMGDVVTWTPPSGPDVALKGCWESDPFSETGGTGISTNKALFSFYAADAPGVDEGQTVVHEGTTYSINELRDDSTLIIEAVLTKA